MGLLDAISPDQWGAEYLHRLQNSQECSILDRVFYPKTNPIATELPYNANSETLKPCYAINKALIVQTKV